MTPIEWLALVAILVGLFGALIGSIKGLLGDQWKEHREMHKDIIDNHKSLALHVDGITSRMVKVETVCQMRSKAREETQGGI